MQNTEADRIKKELQKEILEEIDYSKAVNDEEVKELIADKIAAYSKKKHLLFAKRESLGKEIFAAIRGLDVLQELIEDKEITEIMVNGRDHIFVEKKGRLYELPRCFGTKEKLEDVVQQIVSGCNRVVNEASPIVDARLSNGSRVNVILPPVALNGPIITIRRFPDSPYSMKELVATGALPKELAEWILNLVKAKYNILISGGTGSGKTTFLNALSEAIPKDERIITIEDSAELQIIGIANLVRLETRNANVEGCDAITIRDLIKTALRCRPDRILVGEVRGEEAVDMIQCLNTGHDGSLSTGHANSAADMLSRLETMVLMGIDIPLPAIRMQIASAVDIIIHLGRLRDKSRKVLEVIEIIGYEEGEIQTRTLFRFEEQGEEKGCVRGAWREEGKLHNTKKLRAAGLYGL